MSESGNRDAAARQRRVQRLKKGILITLFLLLLLPYLFCALLMVQIRRLNARVDELSVLLTQYVSAGEQAQESVQGANRAEEPTERMTAQDAAQAQESLQGVNRAEEPTERMTAQDATQAQEPATPTEESMDDEAAEQSGWHKVYLTFDDGPGPNTDKILDILAEYDVKATFFVVGKEGEHSREAMKRIVQEGHTLGMHSYSHRYADLYASVDNFEADFLKERAYLEEVTGITPQIYRFPGGSSNKVSSLDMEIFAEYLDGQGVVFYDWNISSGDGGKTLLGREELIRNSTKDIANLDTAVILLHDSAAKPTTVQALPAIIEKILAMDDTVILPITEDTEPVQHIHRDE